MAVTACDLIRKIMQSSNLTAKYRQDYRTPDYTISVVDLDFQLEAENTLVTAISQVERLNSKAKVLHLQGQDLELLELKLNGEDYLDFTPDQEGIAINVGDLAEFSLSIKTRIHPATNTSFQGLYQSGDALCTQCEAESFRKITYFLDRPDVLARYTTKITADKKLYPYLLSNGNLIAQGDLPDGRHWVKWEDPFPKPSYLFALVAGDFDCLADEFITRSGREVKLQLFVDRGNLDRADFAMASLKKAMKWDEARFGLEYDLDIYMIVAVDFFNMGAMENKGLNIFNSKYVLANSQTATDDDYLGVESVIGHEYFHNWTGNRVTCRDWFQLSLKEGLTVFRDQEFSADTGLATVQRIHNVKNLRTHQFAEDASPMSHPIRPEKVVEMNNFYTMTVYEKGAEVIRMLHTLLGENKFQCGMQKYIQTNDGKAVTCDDFIEAMQSATEIDLSQFKHWYSQSGTPVLTVRDEYLPAEKIYRLTISQCTPPTFDQDEKLPLMIPVKFSLYTPEDKKIPLDKNLLVLTKASESFEFYNLDAKPIPALLEDFSAPVKLDYPYELEQIFTLMQSADNDFIRWDASQMAWLQVIKHNLVNHNPTLPSEFCKAFSEILKNYQGREAITATLITVPTVAELAESIPQVDPDDLQTIYDYACVNLAVALQDQLQEIYSAINAKSYVFNQEAVAKRSLRNQCLQLLGRIHANEKLVQKHYFEADNMTDQLSALKIATASQLESADELLADFEQRWKHNGLVMDKWFALQALRPDYETLWRVEELLNHPSFNRQNPNRMRALIGTFAMSNFTQFNRADGASYEFLTDRLIELNASNPQVASRLLDPLIRFENLDRARQNLIKSQLQRLQNTPNLSKDLNEKISKALAV